MAPPRQFTAPNCIFEVDDIGRDCGRPSSSRSSPSLIHFTGTWNHKFDLVHMRHLLGAFSHAGFDALYRRIYEYASLISPIKGSVC